MDSLRTQFGQNLGIAPESAGPPSDTKAWKNLIGTSPVSARFEMLPETKVRRGALLTSVLFQSAVAIFLVSISLIFPSELKTRLLTEIVPVEPPVTPVLLPAPKAPPVVPKFQPALPPPVVATKRVEFAPLSAPRPKQVEVPRQEAPDVKQTLEIDSKALVDTSHEPVRPREPVKIGTLDTGSASVATIDRPVDKVQTGGFGATNGLAGNSNPAKRSDMPRLGALSLPPGSGQGNGTGGATGARGSVASSGFGNSAAISNGAPSIAREVKAGSFATAAVKSDVPGPKQHAEAAPATQPVVILDKPNPVYSEEGRRLGIEGEVLVQVVFLASGEVKVVGVTKGLGHGLDEAAVKAAQQIHFKPALQNGQPADWPATIHIVFQIAF